jgi:hypothetical protein
LGSIISPYILHSEMIAGGATMGKKRRISDGATFEEVQALLLRCTHQLRALMPSSADLGGLDRIEDEMAWQASIDAWITANPKRRGAIFLGIASVALRLW